MDLGKITFFAMAKKRLAWLSQREELLAQNVANADTPKYRPRDLKPFKFQELVKRESMQLNMVSTSANHLEGERKRIRDFDSEKERRPFETAPAGNAVILEEQMAKVNETELKHKLTTDLYIKQLNMLRIAIGKGP